ncbi:MAG: tRNA pseudouridine(55) synthase TruB [Armatimonadetes bacterium]|nr:tRNA pseudouridine(55) synthase TruB [Armatimonadota bacterium]
MHGLLNVNKPPGPTSHDVVARVRRISGATRVGHAGTLDPPACGVLLVCLGCATRIIEYLVDWRKSYRVAAVFGVETDTEDASGKITREGDASPVTAHLIESTVEGFVGRISQIPPMVSAVHHEGRRLYELARAGKTVEREARQVEVYAIRLVDFAPGERPVAVLDVECSKGTYIRTLCADIGAALGCGAHVSALERTSVGCFRVEDALSLDAIEELSAAGRIEESVHSIDDVLADMPIAYLSEDQAIKVVHGVEIPADEVSALPVTGSVVRIHDPTGRLLGMGIVRLRDNIPMLKPEKMFGGSNT